MAVPKRRTSVSKKGSRRSHHAVTPIQVQYCKSCNEPVLPHRVCPNCGFFQARTVAADPEMTVVLVGDREKVEPLIPADAPRDRLEVFHAAQVIGMDESPV